MTIHSVFDACFQPYGRVVSGLETAIAEILDVLRETPLTDSVSYTAEYEPLQELPAMIEISEHLYGGMPVQMGFCNGHNSKLNCLEYHRDSEFNVSTEDMILLVALRSDIQNGMLDTSHVQAFKVPAGVMIECFATTLHYAPCHCSREKGFKMLVALPSGTNTEKPVISEKTPEDRMLFARNKWLLAHKDSPEAASGAYIGLTGKNIDLTLS